MPEPITFTATSARYGLPFLFAGQAQKEFFVNEAHALADLLLHPAIEGESTTPPSAPDDGECWLVGTDAEGEWAEHDGQIAGWQASAWIYLTPQPGMQVFDKSSGQKIFFSNGWNRVTAPELPTTGSVVDTEVREALGNLIETLRNAGVFPAS